MAIRVTVTDLFAKDLKALPPDRGKHAARSLKLFAENPQLPRFKYRPLQGAKDHFIINAKHGDRIILRKVGTDQYDAVDVGPHDNIYRRWDR